MRVCEEKLTNENSISVDHAALPSTGPTILETVNANTGRLMKRSCS